MADVKTVAGFVGSGKVLFNRKVSGSYTGYVTLGNATAFTITPTSNILQRKSKDKGTYGQVLDTVALQEPHTLSITLDGRDGDNMALSVMGSKTTVSQSALTSQDITCGSGGMPAVILDTWLPIIYSSNQVKNISALSVVDATPTSLVLNTDYLVDLESGLILFKSEGGKVTDSEACVITLSAPATSITKISAGTSARIEGKMMFDGKNLVNNNLVFIEAPQVVLTPNSAVDMITEDFATLTIDGSLETPTGLSSPYTITMHAPA